MLTLIGLAVVVGLGWKPVYYLVKWETTRDAKYWEHTKSYLQNLVTNCRALILQVFSAPEA